MKPQISDEPDPADTAPFLSHMAGSGFPAGLGHWTNGSDERTEPDI